MGHRYVKIGKLPHGAQTCKNLEGATWGTDM